MTDRSPIKTALAGMASVGSPRAPMGETAVHGFKNQSANTGQAKQRPRGNTQSGSPLSKAKFGHTNVKATGGAAYGIRPDVGRKNTDPSAGRLQTNLRTFAPAINRSRPNFYMAMSSINP